ncbi:HDIG domain-containing metalloprotein [Halalkalibacter alkalisediminis]|uniref:HDIG domain-containing metalloprotein n=1 Tax=Halalkalibacter alkalisediminis TaxID=935616 RepID=A0ABV6NPU6_9BACI|nr:HDIG domain-containing metalloprotein [Halalkalibacter alkalisediminis]
MGAFYTLQEGTSEERAHIRSVLLGLDRLPWAIQENIITAWITSWKCSCFKTIEEVPGFSFSEYKLIEHVNDVVYFGIVLAERSINRWNTHVNWEELIQILILHDIDKPLLLAKEENEVIKTEIASQIQHGVLGALILNEIGFSDKVISTVATHATNSPFHGSNTEAYILHYADLFSADHALRIDEKTPFYQRMSL